MLHLTEVSFASWLLKSVVTTFVEFRIMSIVACNLWQQLGLEATLPMNMYGMEKIQCNSTRKTQCRIS